VEVGSASMKALLNGIALSIFPGEGLSAPSSLHI